MGGTVTIHKVIIPNTRAGVRIRVVGVGVRVRVRLLVRGIVAAEVTVGFRMAVAAAMEVEVRVGFKVVVSPGVGVGMKARTQRCGASASPNKSRATPRRSSWTIRDWCS